MYMYTLMDYLLFLWRTFVLHNMSHNCNVLIKTQYFILKLDNLTHLVLYKQRHLAFISICIITLVDINPCFAEPKFKTL